MCMCTEWNDGMTNSLPWIISSPLFLMDMGYTFFYMPCKHVAYYLWVCIFFFYMPFWGMWHTFFGYASFHFWHASWACGIPSFGMHLFYIARNMERVIMDQTRNFLLHGLMNDNANSQCRNFAHEMDVYVILITKYEKTLTRVTQFDKNQ